MNKKNKTTVNKVEKNDNEKKVKKTDPGPFKSIRQIFDLVVTPGQPHCKQIE